MKKLITALLLVIGLILANCTSKHPKETYEAKYGTLKEVKGPFITMQDTLGQKYLFIQHDLGVDSLQFIDGPYND